MDGIQRLGKHFVYELLRSNGSVFYVGKGTELKRLTAHEVEARRGDNNRKSRTIRKMWRNGEEVGKRIVFWSDSEDECFAKEKELIAFYGKKNLCNMTDGGEGMCGLPRSEASKKKMSEFMKGNQYALGAKPSTDVVKRRAEKLKGRKMSDEFRRKQSERMKGNQNYLGHHPSQETKEKIRIANLNRIMTWGYKVSMALKGRKATDEHRLAISDGLKIAHAEGKFEGVGQKNQKALKGNQNAKGAVRSPETRKRMSDAQKGNKNAEGTKRSKESMQKTRDALKLIPHTWGHKTSLALKGRKLSEEHKRKIAEGLKKRYASKNSQA